MQFTTVIYFYQYEHTEFTTSPVTASSDNTILNKSNVRFLGAESIKTSLEGVKYVGTKFN